MTAGQWALQRLEGGKKHIPDFYRSDLQREFDRIWTEQKKYYPGLLTDQLKEKLQGKNKKQTWAICSEHFKTKGVEIEGIKRKGKRNEQRLENYQWRDDGLSQRLEPEQLIIVLQEVNGQISSSSGLLGEISDRSKELYFNDGQTVGQYLYAQIKANPHKRLKNQVFYRQDHVDEFERLWQVQSKGSKQLLTNELKKEIKKEIIFYQRDLKSQKGLLSICELEGREIEKDGRVKKIGPRVCPKSSPLFQEFKIWQILNNIKIKNVETKEVIALVDKVDEETRQRLFEELNIRSKLSNAEALKYLKLKPREWELNYKNGIEGNRTGEELWKAYQKICELSGHDIDLSKQDADSAKQNLSTIFETFGIDASILSFDAGLPGRAFEQQAAYQFWHLLYSYGGDNSKTGNERLYNRLKVKFGFDRLYAETLARLVVLQEDHGNLSSKAIRKILPHLKAGLKYDEACEKAGYNHSHSVTQKENEERKLKDALELLPKNSLRNPVVEKILNQMIHVVNAVLKKYGRPDEIRIELARDLKNNAKERKEATEGIDKATKRHEEIRAKLEKEVYPFNGEDVRITQNDIVKYKLYKELENNGYKTLYTDAYIPLEKLYGKDFDIEHIIPRATLFDDSFSNKTLATRSVNLEKGNKTAYDFLSEKYEEHSDKFKAYLGRVETLYRKNKAISRAKYDKLLMKGSEIPDGFIERDLRNTQYIAKKARQLLLDIVRTVTPTTGSVTAILREHWQLINVMKESNWNKYRQVDLIDYETNKEGGKVPVIKDWTKRNDHRHHAMDAITVAFTKPSHIQYFNYLNARRDEAHKKHKNIYAIEQKETYFTESRDRLVKPPLPIDEFRTEAKKHLENTLVSFKAKNKVVTRNKNKANGQLTLTPRGQLHKETIYGSAKFYRTKEEKVGVKFDRKKILQVAEKTHREALLKRLAEFNDDPQKAFGGKNSPAKSPIWLDGSRSKKAPDKVRLVWLEKRYTNRKEVVDPNLKVEKVIDGGIRKILQDRLEEYHGDRKKAFSNLEERPIWLNKEKGIAIKRVAITGVSNAEPLHYKKDHFGKEIQGPDGAYIPTDFVSTRNNHHIAIYRDEKGALQEKVVSFHEAVMLVNQRLPVVNKTYKQDEGWQFLFTMKQNEMFIFPNENGKTRFDPNEVDLTDEKNYPSISPNLFRVQKLASKDYWFRHHLETMLNNHEELKGITYKRISPSFLKGIVKVRLDHLGHVVGVGETG